MRNNASAERIAAVGEASSSTPAYNGSGPMWKKSVAN
jgi:hypothetical protein